MPRDTKFKKAAAIPVVEHTATAKETMICRSLARCASNAVLTSFHGDVSKITSTTTGLAGFGGLIEEFVHTAI